MPFSIQNLSKSQTELKTNPSLTLLQRKDLCMEFKFTDERLQQYVDNTSRMYPDPTYELMRKWLQLATDLVRIAIAEMDNPKLHPTEGGEGVSIVDEKTVKKRPSRAKPSEMKVKIRKENLTS